MFSFQQTPLSEQLQHDLQDVENLLAIQSTTTIRRVSSRVNLTAKRVHIDVWADYLQFGAPLELEMLVASLVRLACIQLPYIP